MLGGTLRIREYLWDIVASCQLATVSVGVAWLVYLIKSADDGFSFMDHVNFVFYESGHPNFGMFGSTLGLYSRMIGQLTMRVIVWLAFLWQRDSPCCSVAVDDWRTNIFSRWGVLVSDTVITHQVSLLGRIGMFAV